MARADVGACISTQSPTQSSGTELTSLFSSGVPGIGTSALTGNDSGCSGMLSIARTFSTLRPGCGQAHICVLGHLVNEPYAVCVRFAEPQDATRAHADARVADS